MKKRFFILLTLPFLFSCSKEEKNETLSNYAWAFGTKMTVTFIGGNTSILNTAITMINDYSKLSDAYNSWSGDDGVTPIVNLYQINIDENEGKEIEVDPRLAELLSYGLTMKEETSMMIDGEKNYFLNPLIGNVTSIWKTFVENKNHDQKSLPSEEAINTALEEMNSSSLTIDGNKVTRHGKAKIDVGAYAKGYVVKKVQDYLISEGITIYSVNGGSSSLGLGTAMDGGEFRIHIDRETDNGTFSSYFTAKNTAVGTSGVSEQGRKFEGKTYSHIIDPRDGSGEAKYDTVSVMAKDAALCDVLSTTIFVGGASLAEYLSTKYDFGYMIFDGKEVIAKNDKLPLVVE